jgi:hypothetical protein
MHLIAHSSFVGLRCHPSTKQDTDTQGLAMGQAKNHTQSAGVSWEEELKDKITHCCLVTHSQVNLIPNHGG